MIFPGHGRGLGAENVYGYRLGQDGNEGWTSSVSDDEMPRSYFGEEEAKMPSSGLPICDLTECYSRTER